MWTLQESNYPLWVRLFGKLLKYVDKEYTRHIRNIDEIKALENLGIGERGTPQPIIHGKIETAAWIIPAFDPEKMYAGVYTALRFMALMERKSIHNTLILYGDPKIETERVRDKIFQRFKITPKVIHIERDVLPEVDAAFATFWSSAYILQGYVKAKRHIYFIQDYEPEFGPANAMAALAHETYRLPMDHVVHGLSLARYLKERFNDHQHVIPYSVEPEIYYPPKVPPADKPFRVFFYGRPHVDRNDFALGAASLKKAKQLIPDLEVYCAGEPFNQKIYGLNKQWWHNMGLLTREQTAELYRRCHIVLAFGFTKNMPMVAIEAMACGCLLITNANGYEEWITNKGETGVAVTPTPSNIAKTLLDVKNNWGEYAKVARMGQKHAASWNWDQESQRVLWELESEEHGQPSS
ncbi:MAG: glycosyltransferase family 4 protein [Thermoprotei archaeon]